MENLKAIEGKALLILNVQHMDMMIPRLIPKCMLSQGPLTSASNWSSRPFSVTQKLTSVA